jgi:hypothetical protein
MCVQKNGGKTNSILECVPFQSVTLYFCFNGSFEKKRAHIHICERQTYLFEEKKKKHQVTLRF